MAASDEIRVGDQVNVPGGMYGTVRFLGVVDGKPGRFAGIELATEHAARGKNNGDVDGRSYFNTTVPGAGIFVPINNSKYVTKRNVVTPPTPSRPSVVTNFSKSVGPPSVARPKVRRPSLPRPESPRSAPSTKLTFGALRSPSATVPKPMSAGSLGPNGFPRSPQKPSSRLSNRPSSRLSVDDDEIPTLSRPSIGRPSSSGRGAGSQEIQALQEKIKSLEEELQARDRQLDDQASVLTELQQSITELEGQDGASIRAQLREKNEKIAQLTAEFDSHRADFRSTLDTLEVAATETERVYEKRLDELMQQNRELQDRGEDVEAVALQLKQLEELVSELEEGLEDARRGEAEARGEVEFLRGEVERAQLELKQEREKSAAALKDAEGRWNGRELEQKDDEIRGLKAIIHSLSRGEVNPAMFNTNGTSHGDSRSHDTERISQLEERIKELEGVAEIRSSRIDELQRELGQNRSPLGRDSPGRNSPARNSIGWNSLGRNSMNGSRSRSGTVTIAPLRQMKSSHSARGSRSSNPVSHGHSLSDKTVVPNDWQETRGSGEPGPLPISSYRDFSNHRDDNDDLRDSDNQSSEGGSLWCEICETNGHDILTCTTFGTNTSGTDSMNQQYEHNDNEFKKPHRDVIASAPAEIPKKMESPVIGHQPEVKPEPMEAISPSLRTGRDTSLPGLNGMGGMLSSMGPVAGKASGVIDESKWCALCERDGHESIDCPFED
ncbi:hypothetical protein EYB26_007747 [Talaromyces marneffei]|uniref:uncharacterized protein n=1 Tax=Talaromyces marneffei TaxID=37727 RepID=UPI0012A8D57E|nr:uncharacterized protein EYB26_007747 [Talaromyces marneffei]QGA20047.1 hypothetical protein EYB26_007747 [Talaromyces marneffei]